MPWGILLSGAMEIVKLGIEYATANEERRQKIRAEAKAEIKKMSDAVAAADVKIEGDTAAAFEAARKKDEKPPAPAFDLTDIPVKVKPEDGGPSEK